MADAAAPVQEAPATEQPKTTDAPGFLDTIEKAFSGVPEPTPQLHGQAADPLGDPPEPKQIKIKPDSQRPEGAEDEPEDEPEGEPKAEAKGGEEKDELDKLLEFEPPEDESAGWTPKAAATFRKSKEALAKARTDVQSMRSELQQTQARLREIEAATDNPDVEALRAKVQEYERMSLITDVEKSRAFQTMVTEPLTEMVAEADDVAERNGIDPDALIEAMAIENVKERKEALSELLANTDDEDRYKVYSLIERMQPIWERRKAIYDNIEAAAAEAKEIEAAQAKRAAAEALQNRQKAAKAVAERITDRMPFLADVKGLDMEALVKEAGETDPAALDPVKASFNAIGAKLMPLIARHLLEIQQENDKLIAQLAAYEKADPGAGGGGAPGAASRSMDAGGFLDAVTRQLGG